MNRKGQNLFLILVSIVLFSFSTYAQETTQLQLNQTITKEITKGERHKFAVSIEAGKFARIAIEQTGLKVSFDIISPENQRAIRISKPLVDPLSEKKGSFISNANQTFQIEVFVSAIEQKTKGNYKIRLEEIRSAGEKEAKIIEAERIYQESPIQLNVASLKLGSEKAKQALALFQAANDLWYQEVLLSLLGRNHTLLIQHQTAIDYYDQAFIIQKQLGNRRGEGLSCYGKGFAYNYLGEPQAALENLEKALVIFRELNAKELELDVLAEFGKVLTDMGAPEKGLIYLQEAESKGAKGVTLERTFALAYFALGDYQKSVERFKKVESLGGDFPAVSLLRNGIIHSKVKEFDKAFEYFEKALEVHKRLQNKYLEAMTLTYWGEAEYNRNQKEKALIRFQESLRVRSEIADFQGEALSRFWIARIEFEKGNLEKARAEIEKTVNLSEKYRTKIGNDELRTSYFASVSDYYQLYIEILNELHRKLPTGKFDEKSFEISERARARSLLDLLRESRTEIRQGVDVKLLKKERDTQIRADELSRTLIGIRRGENKDFSEKEIESSWQKAQLELENIRAEIRQKSPKYANLTQSVPLSTKEIQDLLDDETVLLEYKLGETRSFLWFVSKNELKVFDLPNREELRKLGKDFYDATVAKGKTDEFSLKLKQVLFPQNIQNKRVVVVADGILQYLPFSALIENELVVLPSASILSELRQTDLKPSEKMMAIFADPVFEANDTRLEPFAKAVKTSPKPGDLSAVLRNNNLGENLPRLLSSRFEANNISAFAPQNKTDVHLDFNATRAKVEAENISKYQILHFATHGLLDSSRPEFSGLVFSLFDKNGKSQDGFLQLNQIYNLNLQSDLVVLSACQTALGKDVKGEGLIGLTRGFMYAGAKRIVASLWKVDDAATAEFMKKFYQNLLVKKLKPVTALRQTQNEMRQIPRYKSPYYWAGFTIQGDWR